MQLIHQEGEEKATMMLDGKFFRAVDKNCWNLEERISEMDKTGEEGGREGCLYLYMYVHLFLCTYFNFFIRLRSFGYFALICIHVYDSTQ